MTFRSEVPSGTSRPFEAVVWVSESEPAKSIAELQTSTTITGAELHSNFEVLDSL